MNKYFAYLDLLFILWYNGGIEKQKCIRNQNKMPKPNPKIKPFQLHDGKTSSKLIGLVVLVALFFIGLIFVTSLVTNQNLDRINQGRNTSNNQPVVSLPIESNDIIQPASLTLSPKQGDLPEGFPRTIPLNESMSIIESNSFKYNPTGEITESTVLYQSKNNIKENTSFYDKWAKENKWQVVVNVGAGNKAVTQLSLSKENQSLTIGLDELLYDTTKVTLNYKVADSRESIENLDQIFKTIKSEPIKK